MSSFVFVDRLWAVELYPDILLYKAVSMQNLTIHIYDLLHKLYETSVLFGIRKYGKSFTTKLQNIGYKYRRGQVVRGLIERSYKEA